MDVRLLVAHAKADAKQIALGRETLIGRSPECNLRIASGQVSRKHCVIRVEDSLVTVRDLGSANGTRLNGQAIKTEVDMPIPPGSTLVVGPLKFVVQFTAPRLAEDTELLTRSAVGESSQLQELQRMAAAPVADGEETKDYPPSRTRKRGVAPPLVVKSDTALEGDAGVQDRETRPVQGRTTEPDFSAIPNETVFDNVLDEIGPDGVRRVREERPPPRIGGETDFVFEEDDLRQLAEAIDSDDSAPPVADAPAVPETFDPAGSPAPSETETPVERQEQPKGWRLMDMLRRKKKPAKQEPPSPPAHHDADDDADDALNSFLKDQ
jgi:pSer/pThr/pTyr-binding forkhead associated (FHA) protein